MASSDWSPEDEKVFQQLMLRRSSQRPVLSAGSTGAMTDGSKRQAEDAGIEDPEWETGSQFLEPIGGLGELATRALLPAGVSSMEMWGRTKFAFGKYEKEKKSYKAIFEGEPSYVGWCRKHLTEETAKGAALDWSRYVKARDMVDCKASSVPFYAGTTIRREFCD